MSETELRGATLRVLLEIMRSHNPRAQTGSKVRLHRQLW